MDDRTKEGLMREALAEAMAGMAEGEVPIGCVIAVGDEGRIVARGHNRVNGLGRKNAHAEIVAFENAGGDPPKLPLDATDAVLVSTLEPCVMCFGAAIETGISTILFGLPAPADCGTGRVSPPQSPEFKIPKIEGSLLASESRELFEKWLRDHPQTEQAAFVRQLLELTEPS